VFNWQRINDADYPARNNCWISEHCCDKSIFNRVDKFALQLLTIGRLNLNLHVDRDCYKVAARRDDAGCGGNHSSRLAPGPARHDNSGRGNPTSRACYQHAGLQKPAAKKR